MSPEVLFALECDEDLPAYFPFIFSQGLDFSAKPMPEKFFSFMSTDENGFNEFFHCLSFHEEISQIDLQYDFEECYDILQQKSN